MPELIDRQATLKKMCETCGYCERLENAMRSTHPDLTHPDFVTDKCNMYKFIAEQPTIEPERKKGHINICNGHECCSECGRCLGIGYTNYCGYCGAELEVMLPESKEAYERSARIIDQMKPDELPPFEERTCDNCGQAVRYDYGIYYRRMVWHCGAGCADSRWKGREK